MKTEEIEEIIARELPQMPGWCTPEKGKRLAEISRHASLCVELGVFGGRSLVSLGLGMKFPGRVDGIDPFTQDAALEGTNDPANSEWWSRLDYNDIAHTAQATICRLGLYEYVRLVRMKSNEVVSCYSDGSIDVLHQDSNHSEEVSCAEVELWAPKMKPRGIWILDDTNWPSTKRAQEKLEALGFAELEDHESWKVYRAP